jgi:hypothetical protein
MLMGLRDYLIQNSTVVATIPNLNGLLTTLQSLISQIQAASQLQVVDKTGVKVAKEELKGNLILIAGDVARRLSAYAAIVNNDGLLNEVHYSDAELMKLSEERLKEVGQVIYDRGIVNVTAAATYGLTAQLMASLLTALNAFNAAIPKPRLTVAERRQATEQLVRLFKDVDVLLKKVDILVDIVKLSQPNFHTGFKTVRVLVERGERKRMLTVTVLDLLSNEPIKGVTCRLVRGEDVFLKKSSVKGNFFLKSMPEGTYQMSVSKSGYKSTVVDVYVNKNETSKVKVLLERV